MEIRELSPDEFEAVWPVFQAIIQRGDTYPYAPEMSMEEARDLWTPAPARTFGAWEDGLVVGCYMLKPNQPGLGSHVANCGYMVAPSARGRGVGGELREPSLVTARAAGLLALSFTAGIPTYSAAVNRW